jgi:hypothetical protein
MSSNRIGQITRTGDVHLFFPSEIRFGAALLRELAHELQFDETMP